MVSPSLSRKLVRFAIVGVVVTGSFMALNWCFGHWMGPDLAYLASYPLAVALHFALNKLWTFGDRGGVKSRQVSEYAVMMVTAFLIQTAVFKLLIHYTATPSWLASGLASVAQMALSFLYMQRRIFNLANGRPG